MSRFFLNERESLVNDAIEGVMLSSPYANLVRLDIDPAIRVIARSDWDKSRVAVISGGGAGHEPAHVGFVGKGMLTAAVCGDLFASPSVDAVLNAIVAVTGDRGCLLVVKNYTGDRLNFGLAAEKARSRGLKVEMVIVGDDIALPENNQPRGIGGTVLVHKIAGHAAEQGRSLGEVKAAAQNACDNIFSLGVALRGCSLPEGEDDESRIHDGQVELGPGIHGEPGASILKTRNSATIVDEIVKRLCKKAGKTARLAVMVNNLGGTSELEMGMIVAEIARSPLHAQIDFLIGPATMVSSLDMKGFSLSVIRLDNAMTEALQACVQAPGWRQLVPFAPALTRKAQAVRDNLEVKPSANAKTASVVKKITGTLISLKSALNALDAKVGDGDTGTTFALGARDIAKLLDEKKLPLNDPGALLALVGERLATVMGGSSGVLMSIFFTAAGQKLAKGDGVADALLAGLAQMKRYGGAQPGDRTLIDALQPALEVMKKHDLNAAARAAQKGADATAQMKKANAGRSSYIGSDKLTGVNDPGAVAVAEVFAALAKGQNVGAKE
jgi:dihydroxyacetone kinase